MVGAIIGAVAKLSGDSTLGHISSAFSLFVTVKSAILKARYLSIYWVNTENDEPIPEERFEAEYGNRSANLLKNSDSLGENQVYFASYASYNPNAGAGNDTLFKESDFNLNPEVQQAISYYDDMYLHAKVAFEQGLIDEMQFKALTARCKNEVAQLRISNTLPKGKTNILEGVVFTLVGFIPIAGEVLTPMDAYAMDADTTAMEIISKWMPYLDQVIATSTKYAGIKYTVYELYDEATGEVKYVGRTMQSLRARQLQHWAADKAKKGLDIRAVKIGENKLIGLTYQEVRGLEHMVYKHYTEELGFKLLNKIRPLNETRGVARLYINAALRFLRGI